MRETVAILLIWLAYPAAIMAADAGLTEVTPRTAPELALERLDGGMLGRNDVKGLTVIVNFWATWCPPCRKEMPALQRAWESLRDENILLIGIAVGENKPAVARYVEKMNLEFPIALDPTTDTSSAWGVRGLPTTYVVDPSGRIVLEAVGERDWDDTAMLDRIRSVAKP